jgi:ATP-dependent exoDNAse (exonuclease V) alpha subunit
MGGGGFFLLSGYAGTGKTFLMKRVMNFIEESSMKSVALTAPTHKALRVLRDMTESDNLYTTHSYLGMKQDIDRDGNIVFKKDPYADCPANEYQITIVDEASMVADEIFDELLDLSSHMKIIFVGDSLQIPPVNCPNSLPFERQIQTEMNFQTAELDKIVRQAEGNPIIQTSMGIREQIKRPIPRLSYESNTDGLIGVRYTPYDAKTPLHEGILDKFTSQQFEESPDYMKVIAWTNRSVNKFNKIIRDHIFAKDGVTLPSIIPGDKLVANAPINEGRNTLVQNNEDMEVLSAEVKDDQVNAELTLKVYKAKVHVFGYGKGSRECTINILHEDSTKEFKKILDMLRAKAKLQPRGTALARSAWIDFYKFKERYADVKYAYAITAHKAQGSTYDHAVVILSDLMNNNNIVERNRILYTSVTRPKYTLEIIHK